MKEQTIKFLLDHSWHVGTFLISGLANSFIEYRIGKNKNLPENSLLEIIQNKFFGGQK
jgi:hypothetical protein